MPVPLHAAIRGNPKNTEDKVTFTFYAAHSDTFLTKKNFTQCEFIVELIVFFSVLLSSIEQEAELHQKSA